MPPKRTGPRSESGRYKALMKEIKAMDGLMKHLVADLDRQKAVRGAPMPRVALKAIVTIKGGPDAAMELINKVGEMSRSVHIPAQEVQWRINATRDNGSFAEPTDFTFDAQVPQAALDFYIKAFNDLCCDDTKVLKGIRRSK